MSKRGENIYRRQDGRWEGRYVKERTPQGKKKYGYVYDRTYTNVKCKLVCKLAQLQGADGTSLPVSVCGAAAGKSKTDREAVMQGLPMTQGLPVMQGLPVTQGLSMTQGLPVTQGLPQPQGSPMTQTAVSQQPAGAPVLLRQIVTEWSQSLSPTLKDSTIVRYRNLIKWYILPQLGDKLLSEITFTCMEEYANHLLTRGGQGGRALSRKTTADSVMLLKKILRFAVNRGFYPAVDINSITVRQKPGQFHALSRREQEALYYYLTQHLDFCNLGILLTMFTGLRVGEICALKWEDVLMEERSIYIHQTIQRIQTDGAEGSRTRVTITPPKSSCSVRKIPVPSFIYTLLEKQRCEQECFLLTGSPLFYMEPRTMQNRFKGVLRRCELQSANFHALRHAFATRCVEIGFDIKSLSEILGHSSVNITLNKYVHPSIELKQQNMEKITELFIQKQQKNAEAI